MLGLYLVLPFSSSYDSRTSNVDILSWLLARWLFLKSKTDDIPRCFSGLFCRTLVASNSTLAISEGFLLIDPVSSIRSPLLISINSKLSWINTYNSLFVAEISVHGTTIPFYQYFSKLASNWFWQFCLCIWDACALTCDFLTRYASYYWPEYLKFLRSYNLLYSFRVKCFWKQAAFYSLPLCRDPKWYRCSFTF